MLAVSIEVCQPEKLELHTHYIIILLNEREKLLLNKRENSTNIR